VQRGAGLAVPAGVPQGLALDRAIQEGEFSAPVGAPRRLEAVFRQGVAFHLHDPPLSAAQVLTALDDERGRLRAPVAPTAELRGWLVGVGALVEVRAPAARRAACRAPAGARAARYRPRRASVRGAARC
jgi:WYL domain